ncbi:MAG: hypothetical protein DME19_09025, partial [Verrucomicrobia bacterium]
MNSHLRICIFSAAAMLGLCGAASLQAQLPTGQWDFDNGNLNATVGQPLTYIDGPGGATAQGTQFGTTTSLGIPNIGGAAAQVMKFPANTNLSMGYNMPTPAAANGGGGLVNDWTILMDLLFTGSSDRTWRGLMDVDGSLVSEDAEFFINPSDQLGTGSYFGNVSSNTWHRIGIVVKASADSMFFYIDGVQVGSRSATSGATPALDGRWALVPGGNAALFNDNDGEAASGYVNSIQLREVSLSKGQMAALGGPQASGIPQTLPAVPSFIEKWIPDAGYARANDDVGVIIDKGDSTITGVTLKLDGQTTNPTITPGGSLISVILAAPGLPTRTDHTVVLSFNDSAAGVKNFTNTFRVPTLYEDFEKLVLGASVDPALGGEPNTETNVWTQTPPPGWTIDNSRMPPQSDPASGRPEWEGWSFADWKWWWSEVDNQNRSLFVKARGAIAIADDDEWDDFGGPVRNRGYFNSFLSTPSISLAGVAPNTLTLRFDSSWRPEGFDDAGPDGLATNNQTATIDISYNGGAPINVLHWDSNPSGPFFHPDAENETVFLQLNNPANATNVMITLGLTLGGNDWWWAFDNLVVDAGGILAPSITRQPQSQWAYSGGTVTLSAGASGSEPLTYQWLLNGTNITGATQTNYTKSNFQASDAGDYTVVV